MIINHLIVKSVNGTFFDFVLKGRIVVIDGLSGSGKTFLTDIIRTKQLDDYAQNTGIETDLSLIVIINCYDRNIFEILKTEKNKLIIIDNADIILTQEIADYIAQDRDNQYLIYSRSHLEFHISPNYYAHIVKNKNKFSLEYNFSEAGWY